jgi:hypothetical protein
VWYCSAAVYLGNFTVLAHRSFVDKEYGSSSSLVVCESIRLAFGYWQPIISNMRQPARNACYREGRGTTAFSKK